IKKNSRMLPQYSTFQLSTKQGGLSAPILKDMLDARLLSIWIKLLSSNSFWAITEREKATIMLQNKRRLTPKEALSQVPCRTRGWTDSWKPYVTAWKRFKGRISATHSWPWTLEQIIINDIDGQQFTVKRALSSWYKTTEKPHENRDNQNKKHFWETTYKSLKGVGNEPIPSILEEIFQATNIGNTKKREAATWLHIITVYEIWCWYTQARWGSSLIPQEVIASVITIRLRYEINLLYRLAYQNLKTRPNKAKQNINKRVQSVNIPNLVIDDSALFGLQLYEPKLRNFYSYNQCFGINSLYKKVTRSENI
ncbi:471_t:CDS:2, partial [Ambispora leptoticha]